MEQKHNLFDMQLKNLKKEQEMRHETELDFLKSRFNQKLQLIKDKIL
jgi:hypothetical protein